MFKNFSDALAKKIEEFPSSSDHVFYQVDLTSEALWELYIASFPEGTNPMFRERTDHDCSSCRHFMKRYGNIVVLSEGGIKRESLWGSLEDLPEPYNVVAKALDKKVLKSKILQPFYNDGPKMGLPSNKEQNEITGEVFTWNHFHGDTPRQCIKLAADIPTIISKDVSSKNVLKRALEEITEESVDTTLELISTNSLYRGEEFKQMLTAFKKLQKQHARIKNKQHLEGFYWDQSRKLGAAFSRIRNTAIGTLLQDLSEGVKPLEDAVASFESVMAQANYQRPAPIFTLNLLKSYKKI